jgi:hypothetical protein
MEEVFVKKGRKENRIEERKKRGWGVDREGERKKRSRRTMSSA